MRGVRASTRESRKVSTLRGGVAHGKIAHGPMGWVALLLFLCIVAAVVWCAHACSRASHGDQTKAPMFALVGFLTMVTALAPLLC
jgi:hypothetical protein